MLEDKSLLYHLLASRAPAPSFSVFNDVNAALEPSGSKGSTLVRMRYIDRFGKSEGDKMLCQEVEANPVDVHVRIATENQFCLKPVQMNNMRISCSIQYGIWITRLTIL